MSRVRGQNAFGADSPSWNLDFPSFGRLTAVEILTYLPHWLKSVDIIDRFVTNGARSNIIASMINTFRYQPGDAGNPIPPNSICAMMQYTMRKVGFAKWTIKTHSKFPEAHKVDPTSLSVAGYRTPRITHPKSKVKAALNEAAPPVQFASLALHVKQHPVGDDALDLTRCVRYALDHPEENWFFPTDFERLVNQLGGETTPASANSDSAVFTRYTSQTGRQDTRSLPLTTQTNNTTIHPAVTDTGSSEMARMPSGAEANINTTSIKPANEMVQQDMSQQKNNIEPPAASTKANKKTTSIKPDNEVGQQCMSQQDLVQQYMSHQENNIEPPAASTEVNNNMTFIKPANEIGQQYIGQQYIGQQYIGQQYIGQPYIGQPYTSQPYMSQPYMSHQYVGQPYMCQPYLNQQYMSEQYVGQPYMCQPFMCQQYVDQPYIGQPHMDQQYMSEQENNIKSPKTSTMHRSGRLATEQSLNFREDLVDLDVRQPVVEHGPYYMSTVNFHNNPTYLQDPLLQPGTATASKKRKLPASAGEEINMPPAKAGRVVAPNARKAVKVEAAPGQKSPQIPIDPRLLALG